MIPTPVGGNAVQRIGHARMHLGRRDILESTVRENLFAPQWKGSALYSPFVEPVITCGFESDYLNSPSGEESMSRPEPGDVVRTETRPLKTDAAARWEGIVRRSRGVVRHRG